jgi:pyruvate,water dikinase
MTVRVRINGITDTATLANHLQYDVRRRVVMSDSPYVECRDGVGGFATTEAAYREFVQAARLRPLIATQLRRLREGADLVAVGAFIRTAFFDAKVAPDVARAITDGYRQLGGPDAELSVSCLPVGEPLDEFLTGPQEIFFDVHGDQTLLSACKRCWASAFNDRAIIYREVRGIDHLAALPLIGIEPMPVPAQQGVPDLVTAER